MYIIYKHRILSFMKVTAGGDILWCVKCLVYECYCTKMGGPSSLAPIFQPKTTESSHYKTHQSVHLLSFFPVIFFQKSPLKQKFHPSH